MKVEDGLNSRDWDEPICDFPFQHILVFEDERDREVEVEETLSDKIQQQV